jgi:phospholipid transport system substrate-binding protein
MRRSAIDIQDLFMTASLLCRRGILAMAGVILLPVAVSPHAYADGTALGPIHQLIEGLLRIMKAGKATPFSQRFDMLAPVIDQTFDLTTILKASVGATWDTLPHDQQTTLLRAFRRYTVASYVSGFDEDNERLVVNPEPRTAGNEQVVRTKIVLSSGEEHELDYVMRQGPVGWRVVDILVDGAISRVATQRSDFRQLIKEGGAPALAQSLETKSAYLSH